MVLESALFSACMGFILAFVDHPVGIPGFIAKFWEEALRPVQVS
jgi:hypothetical protein